MKKFLIPFFLIGSLVMIYVMAKTGGPLKTTATPHGILDLEFAYKSINVNTILKAWAPVGMDDNIGVARLNTWLDFIFLFFYSGLLSLAAKKIALLYGGAFSKAGKYIYKGALLAGIFDCFENTGMLLSLSGYSYDMIAFCTTFFSVLKWFLALLAFLYVLTGAIGLLRNRINN